MIEVGVIDLSAEGRRRLAALVERWIWVAPDAQNISLPRISIRSLSPEEVKFHGSLDICLVGPELVACDIGFVSLLRKQIPEQLVVAIIDGRSQSFGIVEQLSRIGVDDVLSESASSEEFFRRIIILTRRARSRTEGRLVTVDSARGGVGATFVTAGAAECALESGKSVCVVDCDVVSQDLTRFLQVRPFVNEPLKVLLSHQRIVTTEAVKECVFPVWEGESRFVCVAPPAASDETVIADAPQVRAFLSVLDVLKSLYDYVIVDASPLVLATKHALYQVSDHAILVLNRDPAGAYANRQAIGVMTAMVPRHARVSAVISGVRRGGMPRSLIEQEVLSTSDIPISVTVAPYSSRAASWACSGRTPYRYLSRIFDQLLFEDRENVRSPEAKTITTHSRDRNRGGENRADGGIVTTMVRRFLERLRAAVVTHEETPRQPSRTKSSVPEPFLLPRTTGDDLVSKATLSARNGMND